MAKILAKFGQIDKVLEEKVRRKNIHNVLYLNLLDGIVRKAKSLCGRELCDLGHQRRVSCLCMLYKIYNNPDHALRDTLVPAQRSRFTRAASSMHGHQLVPVRCKTEQFKRCFVPRAIEEWNGLSVGVFKRFVLFLLLVATSLGFSLKKTYRAPTFLGFRFFLAVFRLLRQLALRMDTSLCCEL